MRQLYVYILSSHSRRIYVGVTNNLVRRLYEHRTGSSQHSAKYKKNRLVYYELVAGPMNAIRREKQIKAWTRAKRVALVERNNPAWIDLAEGWFEAPKQASRPSRVDPSLRSG